MTTYLTTKDLCDRLQISRWTIDRLVTAGSFPAPKLVGRGKRWPHDVLEKWQPEGTAQ